MIQKYLHVSFIFCIALTAVLMSNTTVQAKEYNVTLEYLDKDVYLVKGTDYILETTLCNVKPKFKDKNKIIKGVASFTKLRKHLEFEGKKVQCSIKTVYKKYDGELD